jgi:filamentous hemagglutinin
MRFPRRRRRKSSDGRLSALQGTKAALSGIQAAQAVALDGARGGSDKDNNNTIGISASLGSQSSSSRTFRAGDDQRQHPECRK